MAFSNKNDEQQHQKSNWDDMAIEDSASDLEDSWAGEEVMFDGSPSSGIFNKTKGTLVHERG